MKQTRPEEADLKMPAVAKYLFPAVSCVKKDRLPQARFIVFEPIARTQERAFCKKAIFAMIIKGTWSVTGNQIRDYSVW